MNMSKWWPLVLAGAGGLLLLGAMRKGGIPRGGGAPGSGTGGGGGDKPTGGGSKPSTYPGGTKLTLGVVPADLPQVTAKRWTEEDARQAISHIARVKGVPHAAAIEKTWRIESWHFRSGEYKATGGAGMIPFAATEPWGWGRKAGWFWKEHPDAKPIGWYLGHDKKGKPYPYLAFRHPLAFAATLAAVIDWGMKEYKTNDPLVAVSYWVGGGAAQKERLYKLRHEIRSRWT